MAKALPLALVLVLAATVPGCFDQIKQSLDGPTMPQDYLRDKDHSEWVIEVDYVGGVRPSQSVLDFVKGRIAPLVHKPDGVTFTVDDQLGAGDGTWTNQELLDLSKRTRDIKTSGDLVSTHLLFVDGGSSEDTSNGRVLGVAMGFDLIVIFVENIEDSCSPLAVPPCTYSDDQIIRAVTVHEFGHALGLVNRKAGDGSRPVPMQDDHEDDQHPGHSDNNGSVMYWAVESSVIGDLFRGGSIPTTFDSDDKADLCAAGGRC